MPTRISRSGSATLFHPLNQEVDQQKRSESVSNGLQCRNFCAISSRNRENKNGQLHGIAYEQPQYYAPAIYAETHLLRDEIKGANSHSDMNGNIQQPNPNTIFNANCRSLHNVHRSVSCSVRSMNRAPLNVEQSNELSSETSEDEDQIEITPIDGHQNGNPNGAPRCDDKNVILNRQLHLSLQSQDSGTMNSRGRENQNFRFHGPGFGQLQYKTAPIYANTHMLQAEVKGADVYMNKFRSSGNVQQPVYHSANINAYCRIQHKFQTFKQNTMSVEGHAMSRGPLNVDEEIMSCSSTSSELSENVGEIGKTPKDGTQEKNRSGSRRCIDEIIIRPELPVNVVPSNKHHSGACLKSFLRFVKYCLLFAIGLVVGAGINYLYKCWSQENEQYS